MTGVMGARLRYDPNSARDWMSNALIYEINTWEWLSRWNNKLGGKFSLSTLPDAAWDEVKDSGATAVWLMGVWERSPAGVALSLDNKYLMKELRSVFPTLQFANVIGSPFCVQKYEVDERLGGRSGLLSARKKLRRRGLRLILDFVPNHVAFDHSWVIKQPKWFLQGTSTDLALFPNRYIELHGSIFAFAKDPNLPAWSDVLQLNAFKKELRMAAVSELKAIANQCDGVRCDMAMLLMNDIFAKTWGSRPGTKPAVDYWPAVIPDVKREHPNFCFIAEVYWGKERELLEQGFDACYDKRFYDHLVHDASFEVIRHLKRMIPFHKRLIRFLENHDEPRIAQAVEKRRAFAASLVWMTVPGIHLLHEGQSEGRKIRAPLHVNLSPEEKGDVEVIQWYLALIRLAKEHILKESVWRLRDVTWSDDKKKHSTMAWTWETSRDCLLVIVNYGHNPEQAAIDLPFNKYETSEFHVLLGSNQSFLKTGATIHVQLPSWGYVVLCCKRP